jgi:hypothetical protein
MSGLRRHVLRPTRNDSPAIDAGQARLLARRQAQLTKDRLQLKRWMSRLRRAFHSVERLQARISRLERQSSAKGRPTTRFF